MTEPASAGFSRIFFARANPSIPGICASSNTMRKAWPARCAASIASSAFSPPRPMIGFMRQLVSISARIFRLSAVIVHDKNIKSGQCLPGDLLGDPMRGIVACRNVVVK